MKRGHAGVRRAGVRRHGRYTRRAARCRDAAGPRRTTRDARRASEGVHYMGPADAPRVSRRPAGPDLAPHAVRYTEDRWISTAPAAISPSPRC
ncbi:hypothetical protein FEP63_04772 [Burkholderia multivorans]|nr:hypothetical protein [Burkholderia multivorans]MDR8882202.1 hypothetical protein [Burkholderia multivorans]MDR8889095.1 hypothetical protein [Burkholderia multivorans]MDR8893849.1 hypothetical protein [Burkholderia multivorans]MDR8900806.1 hypothetical protein [Burkholderia multivorans]